MNSAVGYGLILLALVFAVFGAVAGIVSGARRTENGSRWVMRAVYGFFFSMLGANLVMEKALITHDFSVKYVAQVGSTTTPLYITIVSLWSALEGSILFWGLILATYIFIFALVYRHEHTRYRSLALGTMLGVGVFFAFLLAGPANPFPHLAHPPADGPGPNPLLQNNALMIIHPPMLYCGYVGMTVPFGIAVAALIRGEIGTSWMASLRRWSILPWMFLSLGIILGSWWAYKVLGWGGYWSWDPVENASFLPWLCMTALLHSAMVQERRKILKLWTLSLALGAFLLTLLGTFMTRSGIFNSVHSFTQSDIGPTFLVFIGIVLVFCIVLLAVRGPILAPEGEIQSVVSRETAILVNNLLLVAITFTVLIGTLFPLIREGLTGVRVSVGAPYFDKMAVPGAVALLFLMGVGPMLPWGKPSWGKLKQQLIVPALVGVGVLAGCLIAGLTGFYALLTFTLAGFVATITLRELYVPVRLRMKDRGEKPWTALYLSATRARRRFGGYVIHLGIVMVLVAVAASQSYITHAQGTLGMGQSLKVGNYHVKLVGITSGAVPHRTWTAAQMDVTLPSGEVVRMQPRMNQYDTSREPVGTPAVRSRPVKDFYVSILSISSASQTVSFNAWVFPLVWWIWYSIPVFVFGALFAVWPSRRREVASAVASIPVAGADPKGAVSRGAA